MEIKMKVYVVCIEEDGHSGIIAAAYPFRTFEEAWKFAEQENATFKNDYGENIVTGVQEGYSIYSHTDDYYIYITVSEHFI